ADRNMLNVDPNTPVRDKRFEGIPHLSTMRGRQGTVAFPRLDHGDVDDVCRLLRQEYDTTVVPGRFFGLQDHFRIGIGGDTQMVSEGLSRLSAALQEMK